MKKRILDPATGKFTYYNGPAPVKAVIKSAEQQHNERKNLDVLAESGGFTSENPVVGGLSEVDKKLIAGGMSLGDMMNLANTRKVSIPKDLEDKASVAKFLLGGSETETGEGLSEADKEKVRAGISIPEMRKLAKDRGVKIPSTAKKAIEINNFLLGVEVEPEAEL